ncbi:FAD-dependent oxidoreductase [Marinobacter salicampi]|uniref:FAD-dependent oxidoreductase n=1 Tax=Marinobacter salicampi TaxID=435907 RepID=UPI0014081C46|nr:FAD-dependent oxidoreductase [Marinobacter salicampi]
MTQQADIVVIGAGMVGAALATGLGQSGFRVALVDRASEPDMASTTAPDLRVSAISAGSERYLRKLGAWSRMEQQRLTPYRRLSVWDQSPYPLSGFKPQPARTTFSARELDCSHLGHIVENQVTQRALWECAKNIENVQVHAGDSVRAIHNGTDDARVTLESGLELTCQLVIGADGAQSRVRTLAGIGVSRDQYAQQALVASVRYRGPVQDITWQAFFPSGPRAFLPLHANGEESWASLVWYDAPDVLARLKSLSGTEFLAAVQSAFPEDLPTLTHVEARASFPIAKQHASRYVEGRVVLVGDAAHTINPLAGQGVNLGFQDAEELESQLREARRAGSDLAEPFWLGRYEIKRRPANRRMMLAMDAFYYLFSNRLPPVHLLRNLGLGLAQHLPFARNQVARYAMGLEDGRTRSVAGLLASLPRPGFMKQPKGP